MKTVKKSFSFKKNSKNRINEQIKVPEVVLISEKGENLGIIKISEALSLAKEKDLDLVEISPFSKPPVCKIIDWGKFQYQQAKKLQKNRLKQKKNEIKGIRIRPNTGANDLNFKLEQTKNFLRKGYKVKIEIILKGREKIFLEEARKKLKEFIDKIDFETKIEQDITRQFNGFFAVIIPKS